MSERGSWAVVKDSLTAQMRPSRAATVKQSLTVQVEAGRAATTEESSVVQIPEPVGNSDRLPRPITWIAILTRR